MNLHNWIDMRGPDTALSVLINDFLIAREAKLSQYTISGYTRALNHLDELLATRRSWSSRPRGEPGHHQET